MTSTDLPITRLHYSGTVDVNKLLNAVRGWYSKEQYKLIEGTYKHKEATAGHDIEVEMEGTKKINEYIKYYIVFDMKFRDAEPVDIAEGGKTRQHRRGKLIIELKPKLDMDWQETFDAKGWKHFKHFIYSYIIKPKNEDQWDKLYYKAIALQKTIKAALGMSTT